MALHQDPALKAAPARTSATILLETSTRSPGRYTPPRPIHRFQALLLRARLRALRWGARIGGRDQLAHDRIRNVYRLRLDTHIGTNLLVRLVLRLAGILVIAISLATDGRQRIPMDGVP